MFSFAGRSCALLPLLYAVTIILRALFSFRFALLLVRFKPYYTDENCQMEAVEHHANLNTRIQLRSTFSFVDVFPFGWTLSLILHYILRESIVR